MLFSIQSKAATLAIIPKNYVFAIPFVSLLVNYMSNAYFIVTCIGEKLFIISGTKQAMSAFHDLSKE